MNFTTEEIDLCKEIAKYYWKPIYFGDWFYDEELNRPAIHVYTMILNEYMSDRFPLWTWQDARDWMREKGYTLETFSGDMHIEIAFHKRGTHYLSSLNQDGNTDLEAILKVVLKILKEEK